MVLTTDVLPERILKIDSSHDLTNSIHCNKQYALLISSLLSRYVQDMSSKSHFHSNIYRSKRAEMVSRGNQSAKSIVEIFPPDLGIHATQVESHTGCH